MDKFGLFNIIEKLSPLKDVLKPLAEQLEKKEERAGVSNETAENINQKPKNIYSQTAVYNFIKRHDEISKRIDKNLKK